MINAPSGMSTGMPPATGSSCSSAPAPLVGGGLASPIQVGVPTAPAAGAGALGMPALGVPAPAAAAPATAAIGAATLTPVVGGATPTTTASLTAALGAPGAMPAPMPAAAPLSGAAALPATTGLVPAPVAGAAAAPAPAGAPAVDPQPQRLTTVAPGGNANDANLVENTLNVLRQSPSGAAIVDRMLAVNARINVISDEEFAALGHADAHAFYDPKLDAMFLRRSDLADQNNIRFAAVALAHEGTHLLDDVGKVADPFIDRASAQVAAAGGPSTAQGAALQEQAMWELMMIKEARAFTFAGQIARDLGVKTPANDPTSVAAAGANDQATYDRVWQALLDSAYNTERRTGASKNF